MRPRSPLLFRILAVAGACLGVSASSRASSNLDVRAHRLVGNELRLIVETSRTWTPLLAHSSKTADAKGYYVAIDLSPSSSPSTTTKPLAMRARVVGPLWEVPNERSSISFTAGANFTKEDAAAAAATPQCAFDLDGTLLRFTSDAARKSLVRESLALMPGGASWQGRADVKPVDDHLPPGSEDRLLTPSGRYILLFQKGKAELFDLFTGERKNDDWLTSRFADCRAIKDFQNVRASLTEDLNHLVASPMEIWNDFPNGIHKTFELGGKVYNRADVGLAYSRPAREPILFPRKLDVTHGFLAEPPHGAYSIDGKLYLFEIGPALLRLYTPDGKNEIKTNPPAAWQLEMIPLLQIQHVPPAGEIVMFGANPVTAKSIVNEIVYVIRWNYAKNSPATRDQLRIYDLFEERGGRLHPKAVQTVK